MAGEGAIAEITIADMAAAVKAVRIAEARRLERWKGLARTVHERGEVAAFDLSGLDVRFAHLVAAEAFLVSLVPVKGSEAPAG